MTSPRTSRSCSAAVYGKNVHVDRTATTGGGIPASPAQSRTDGKCQMYVRTEP